MTQIAPVFRKFVPQLLHIVVLPVFFFTFMLLLRPEGVVNMLGKEWFGVHLTIMSCIILVSEILIRILYYFLPLRINYSIYTLWCFGEIIFMSFFTALYLWLVLGKTMLYFEFVTASFRYLFLSLIFAYAILALAMRIYDYRHKEDATDSNPAQRMRFYDNQHNLKLVLFPTAILYIQAEENYVNINYIENDRVKEFVLRSSMKALDEICQDHGLVRCHRSFYINPARIKVLRKDKDGIMYAELDADDVRTIPVSKTYYRILSDVL